MQYILKVRQIYDEYLSDAARLQAAMKATDGLLGFGRRADSDPCHDRFYRTAARDTGRHGGGRRFLRRRCWKS